MPRPNLVIDARPRGPNGPMAGELVGGRPVLDHLVELADALGGAPAPVFARSDEHGRFRAILEDVRRAEPRAYLTGPPPEGAAILRADRLYDPHRLRAALARGRHPDTAVIWRLDRPGALEVAGDELVRRRSYQPLGRFWALAPATALARALRPTGVRPNAVTLASAAVFLGGAGLVAFGGDAPTSRMGTALALALALVLDTADGHLARLQGTATEFGRWLDANLDELNEMALHAAIAWSSSIRDGSPYWLVVGMSYGMGKYLFAHGVASWNRAEAGDASPGPARPAAAGRLAAMARLAGHADVRWHSWILLALLGRLELALIAYAAYFPARAAAGAWRKAVQHA